MVHPATDSDFDKLVSSSPKVVVKYFANWCGSCRLFSPKYKKIAEKDEYKDVVFLDVNAEENPHARTRGGVSNLPHFAVFRHGELLASDNTSKEEAVEKLIRTLDQPA